MPSFDLVSTVDMGELKNALNMAQKQISSRYDFKGSKASLELKGENEIELKAEDDFKMRAALDIFYRNLGKRNIGLKSLDVGQAVPTGNQMLKQSINILSGINKEKGKTINKIVKDSKLKISSQYLDEKVRITGKKIDDLQAIYRILKEHKEVDLDLRMENMK